MAAWFVLVASLFAGMTVAVMSWQAWAWWKDDPYCDRLGVWRDDESSILNAWYSDPQSVPDLLAKLDRDLEMLLVEESVLSASLIHAIRDLSKAQERVVTRAYSASRANALTNDLLIINAILHTKCHLKPISPALSGSQRAR